MGEKKMVILTFKLFKISLFLAKFLKNSLKVEFLHDNPKILYKKQQIIMRSSGHKTTTLGKNTFFARI